MNKSFAAGLGLLAILAQHPLEAQTRARTPSSQAQQAQRDTEFLSLYQEVKSLEDKLANEPPETENRKFTKFYMGKDGKLEGHSTIAPPPSIANIILDKKYFDVWKLASRYDINFDPNETGIFTWGGSLILEKFLEGYAIFNQNSAIVTTNSWTGEKRE